MNLFNAGNPILTCEVTSITNKGIWILVNDKEYFIQFKDFPMLTKIPVDKIFAVDFYPPEHLRWDEFDIDIELSSIENAEKYPNIFNERISA